MLTKKYSDSQTFNNEYDEKGRISSSSYGGTTVNYAYDTHGQLVSANDDTYDYDDRGNITSKTVGDITTTFNYNTDGWKDLLVKVNDDKLTYDANGNVLTYGDKEFTWSYGRTLTGITDGENKYSYTYDENGIRTSKTVNGSTTYYNTDNGTILSQSDGDNTWYFQYDTNGSPLGFVLNGIQYFYITNQMGDILAITDTDGNVVGNYEYDAWGKVLTADTDIAKQNPLRYRGYYYDSETGYYYLQSRYYDSNICRFINADSIFIELLSKNFDLYCNMFSYCNNDPICKSDFTGYSAIAAGGAYFIYEFVILGAIALTGVLLIVYAIIEAIVKAMENASISGKKTFKDVRAKKQSGKHYKFAYIDDNNNLKTIGPKLTFRQALGGLGIKASTNSIKKRYKYKFNEGKLSKNAQTAYNSNRKTWGIFADSQVAAKSLAVVLRFNGKPEIHQSGQYRHYHDKDRALHIWFGKKYY